MDRAISFVQGGAEGMYTQLSINHVSNAGHNFFFPYANITEEYPCESLDFFRIEVYRINPIALSIFLVLKWLLLSH